MANPFTGILLDGKYYTYASGSWKFPMPLKNSSQNTQGNRVFTILGDAPRVHTITLILENTYTVYGVSNNNEAGTTTYLGLSRKTELENILGALGNSMPLVFVAPDGTSHLVVPTGQIDEDMLFDTPRTTGVEYRINLTLENQS